MTGSDVGSPLSRTAASEAVEHLGWRLLLGTLALSLGVNSVEQGCQAAQAVVAAAGADADAHLRIDVRPDRVELSLQTRSLGAVTDVDTRLAEQITAAASALGLHPIGGSSRPLQMLEIAIDTLDAQAIRPFWKAVLGYADEVTPGGPSDGLVDPAGQLPTVWFQQMDQPRPQRNRIHFDITVPHDEAAGRIGAALAAGGRLVSDSRSRAFSILADVEGNEICVCTWQDRDEWDQTSD